MLDWLRHAYGENVRGKGIEGRFLATMSYLAMFFVARGYTTISKVTGGGTHMQLGTTHLHHMIPGLAVEIAGGLAALDNRPATVVGIRREAVGGLLFGAGAALVIDEFCLMLFVEDAYWQDRGVNASMAAYGTVAVALVTNLWLGRSLYRKTTEALAEHASELVATFR